MEHGKGSGQSKTKQAQDTTHEKPMHAESPYIVGIVGGSCAGKSWLADHLQKRLGESASRLSQDDFYLDRAHLPPDRCARLNFDHPRAIDWELFESAIQNFLKGKETSVPRYSFAAHGRLGNENLLRPNRILLVEGLWLYRRPSLRRLFTLKVYIHVQNELCVTRRVQRDTAERGRTRDQVMEQLQRHTLPMFERFVAPQVRWADAIVDAPIHEAHIKDLVNRIQTSKNPETSRITGI